ncbi:hypothetical protein RR46_04775 [Papilio xuthus]|uniref:Uncharacterized protein n=1 Tax=Papilio xuthus TaxID=66420 RepID=A0A194Q2M9_PAPXU|nr:hypothetical protein RR46_04775 [Papilio xuthus]
MAAIVKLTFVFLICCVVFGRSDTRPQSNSPPSKLSEPEHHFEKRSADYDGDDFSDGFIQAQAPYENSFDRPHRIRVLPGFLH